MSETSCAIEYCKSPPSFSLRRWLRRDMRVCGAHYLEVVGRCPTCGGDHCQAYASKRSK